MASGESSTAFMPLDLPRELSDVAGLIQADLQAVVNAIAQQAHGRLLLTRTEYRSLQQTLWNRLVSSLNDVVRPLSADAR